MKILYLDHNTNNLELIRMGMKRFNIEVLTASDYKESLELVKSGGLSCAVVDTGFNGFKLPELLDYFKDLKKENPDIPVLFFSAGKEEHFISALRDAGAADILFKDEYKAPHFAAVIRGFDKSED